MNIATTVERGARLYPGRIALQTDQHELTYWYLNTLANRMANGLRGLGVRQGDRVALLLPNTAEFVISYLGALKIGAVAVSLSPMLKTPEVLHILNDSGAVVAVTNEQLRAAVPDEGAPALRHVVVADGSGDALTLGRLLREASPTAQAAALPPDAPAAIVYTSGTTGVPKGATLSHANIRSTMQAKVHYCGTRPDDRLLLFLPLAHCFGQNAILNHGLHAGATVVLQQRFDPAQVLDAIERQQISMLFGVPTVYVRLLDLDIPPAALRSVRYCFTAGAGMPPEIARRWRERYGHTVYEGYGLTETSPFATYNHHLDYRAESVGTPISGVAVRILDPDGRELPPGERGEIVIRGPNVMLGYWNQPEATRAAIRGGWFHTGDIGVLDEQGYCYVVDRLKDMINVSGFKVYPAEVEHTLYRHPAVAEAAVYGVPDAARGEIVKASILLREGYALQPDDIISFCRSQVANYKVPHHVEFVHALPKNATGKILRKALREQAGERLSPAYR
jgi:long-chain acyl-CoA synthetase